MLESDIRDHLRRARYALPMMTTEHAFAAMRIFLETYWERGGRSDTQIADLLSSIQGAPGATADPAQWGDWLSAVREARGGL